MRKEKITHNGIDVYLDSGTRQWKSRFKAPYYRMRGKRISEEQAFEVIRRCDEIFGRIEEQGIKSSPDYIPAHIPTVGFKMSKFIGGSGWVHPDGIVGLNERVGGYYDQFNSGNTPRKEPDTEMLIEEWTTYAKCFPFLDLVVAITGWDQECPERKSAYQNIGEEYKSGRISLEKRWELEHKLTFADCERGGLGQMIKIGVWVHDGTVEIMNAVRAREKYFEYERLYEEKDRRIYIAYYYKYNQNLITIDYLCRCLAAYGMDDPVEFLYEKHSDLSIYDLKPLLPGVLNGEYIRQEKTTIDGVEVILDGWTRTWKSDVKYPYYRMRGKRVTEEQAFEVIRRCDDFFSGHPLSFHNKYPECINLFHFYIEWFNLQHCSGGFGWMRPNGIVGLNHNTSRWPETDELLETWTELAKNFPFLDLVIAITKWESWCRERNHEPDEIIRRYTAIKKAKNEEIGNIDENDIDFIDLERDDSIRESKDDTFQNAIDIGVWVHDGILEIMEPNRTYEKYLEYERLYEEPDTRIYMTEYYDTFQPDFCGDDYLYKCLRAYGIDDPEKFLSEQT